MPLFTDFYVFLLLISRVRLRESALGSDSAKSRKSSQSRLLCFVVTAIAKLATYHRELLPRARVSLTKVGVIYHLPDINKLSCQQFDHVDKMPQRFWVIKLNNLVNLVDRLHVHESQMQGSGSVHVIIWVWWMNLLYVCLSWAHVNLQVKGYRNLAQWIGVKGELKWFRTFHFTF